jgi:hypothetical protein
MTLPEKYKYRDDTSDDLIRSYKDLPHEQIEAMIILKPFAYSWDSSGRVRFIANEENINDVAKKYFTHIPQGWKEHIKFPIDYEDIKLISN